MEKNNNYKNYDYDDKLYISKGYILPDGTQLTEKYGKTHIEMADRFIMENYYQSFLNDFIEDKQDYMLMRLGALQVRSYNLRMILFCDDNQNKIIQDAIASYLSYGWEEQIIPNQYKSYFDYLRLGLLNDCGLVFQGDISKENDHILKKIKKK